MDFIQQVTEAATHASREIEYEGQTGTVYVRKLTGAQKMALVKGKKYNFDTAEKKVSVVEINLESNEQEQHSFVRFCICDEAGRDRFKNDAEVAKLPAELIAALFKAAQDFNAAPKTANGGDESPGES